MSWWGKLAGGAFGFILGGPLGALLGAVLGHNLDRGLAGLEAEWLQPGEQERVQTAFFTATFSIMGHLAKVDGSVSREEIDLAELVMERMDLDKAMRETAIRLFKQGKSEDFPLDEVVEQFRSECHGRSTLIQMFIEIQLQAAYADGKFNAAEERLLLHICRQMGIPETLFRRLEQMVQAERHFAGGDGEARNEYAAPSLDDAYAILNIPRNASNDEVKRAYRRQTSQHHPDKLVAKGLPEEMMKIAAEKTHEIRQAYEQIKAARGL
ncbi:MAG: co-chaperone DjlA [Chromatiaceae bacterium]|nr:co-chaperone DjlA [Gammaproteobacteria bacterium]MCP5427155.1 co-chaperone DjlA [Chromatiaceae bacterium]MCP5446950.1 co-chaperone DjlA [Chromatiaceae bacterium]